MLAIIDADIVLHRVGYTTDKEEVWIARARCDDMLDGILVDTAAKSYQLWLSDARDKNFRFKISPVYKANRTAPRPVHYDAIKEYLIKQWGARIAHDMEADDAMGIAQDKSGCETVICSIDKDLLQIPGQHYNFVKKEWECVTDWEGIKWFYQQILIGDTSDNVEGCQGIGPVKASKAIHQVSEKDGEAGLFQAVLKTYKKQEKALSEEAVLDRILLAGRLLKIRQQEEEPLWDFPSSVPTTESKSSSTPPPQVESTQSTEPTSPVKVNGLQPLGASAESTSKEEHPASTLQRP